MTDPKIRARLLDEVVIFDNRDAQRTGAQSLAPDHSPHRQSQTGATPRRGALPVVALQEQVQQFLYYQSELLDGKCWQAYIDLFADDGLYWMPVAPHQTDWTDSPSIFAEDKPLMSVRMGRVMHPNAWSQAPHWGTSHLVGNVCVESADDTEVVVRSRFQMLELRRDSIRHFGGTYRHTLRRKGDSFLIGLQRVDMLNAQAPYDYVLQVWV